MSLVENILEREPCCTIPEEEICFKYLEVGWQKTSDKAWLFFTSHLATIRTNHIQLTSVYLQNKLRLPGDLWKYLFREAMEKLNNEVTKFNSRHPTQDRI